MKNRKNRNKKHVDSFDPLTPKEDVDPLTPKLRTEDGASARDGLDANGVSGNSISKPKDGDPPMAGDPR